MTSSKQVFEEALADMRQLKTVAEDNAKKAVLEAVTPRIREFVETALLDAANSAPGSDDLDGELLTDTEDNKIPSIPAAPPPITVVPTEVPTISQPDESGKVTIDLDKLQKDDASMVPGDPAGEEVILSLETEGALKKIDASKQKNKFDANLTNLKEEIIRLASAGNLVKRTAAYKEQISKMISRVDNMYEYVQESFSNDNALKIAYETMLEASFKDLNTIQESITMAKNGKQRMNESDVTLKLTGLPDDLDLDGVGVDLITGEEEGEEDIVGGAEGEGEDQDNAQDGGDLDLDLGGDDQVQENDDQIDEDEVVEIDENMLRKEIIRMRKLREEAVPSVAGKKPAANEFDDFGDASGGKEPLDVSLDESDEGEDDTQLDEDDSELDQLGNRRKKDEFGDEVADGHETQMWSKRRDESVEGLQSESKRLTIIKNKVVQVKKLALEAKKARDIKKFNNLKTIYENLARRYNETQGKVQILERRVAVSTKRLQEARSNNVSTKHADTASKLRAQLSATNLDNAKLLYTNKLLQNESLSNSQKADAIKQLDECKTIREAKLVYSSLVSVKGQRMNEGNEQRVIGSASRPTRPSSTQKLNESSETERWAELAGISKK